MAYQNEDRSRFAIVFLTTLRVAKFQVKDDWMDSMLTLVAESALAIDSGYSRTPCYSVPAVTRFTTSWA